MKNRFDKFNEDFDRDWNRLRRFNAVIFIIATLMIVAIFIGGAVVVHKLLLHFGIW